MSAFIVSAIFSFVAYLVLAFGSGTDFLYWSFEELALGVLFAVLIGIFVHRVFKGLGVKVGLKAFNPIRWIYFVVFLVPFLFALTKANFDVAYRVLTGRINPGIVKIDPKLKSDFGVALLANSITLTPGTLTVDVGKNNELYVHWINVTDKKPKIEQVCGSFADWARRISE